MKVIRSSKHYIVNINQGKRCSLDKMFYILKDATSIYIQYILSGTLPLKTMLSSKLLPSVNGIDGGQYKQLIYKTASEIVRSNLDHVKERTFKRYKKIYRYFKDRNRQSDFLSKKYKELSINYLKRIKIDLLNFSINLDERFVDVQSGNYFDNFVRIKTLFMNETYKNRRIFVNVPIKILHKNHIDK